MMIPIAGMCLISNGEKRINRNASQVTTQIARHATAAILKIVFAMLGMSLGQSSGMFWPLAMNDTS